MTSNTLKAISPLDGRYADKLSGFRPIFSEYGFMRYRVLVEIRWLQVLAKTAEMPELPPFGEESNNALENIISNFSEKDAERIKAIELDINHDVKAVEYYLKECFKPYPELDRAKEFLHFGCTSEDINNLAYALMLKEALEQCLIPSSFKLLHLLRVLAHEYADIPMLSRTHGQPATPTTVGKELANFVARIRKQLDTLQSLPLHGKLNGATGNYNALNVAAPEVNWIALSEQWITQLGLTWNGYTTQIEPHDYLAEFFMCMMRLNTILIDLNRDIWGYIAIQYFSQKPLENEVGSSTMPHKVNPIDFENAEGNLGLSNALLDHMANKLPISRWQRDLSDSTVLRNMGSALAYSFLAYESTTKGLRKISPNLEIIASDLDEHWEVLAEAVQMVMRRYNIENPYEKLKTFTRGKAIDKKLLHDFIIALDLPKPVKKQLLALTPKQYLGYAIDLAKLI